MDRKKMAWKKSLISVVVFYAVPAWAHTFESRASHIFLQDATTGEVLLEKNADELMYPSSMSKIMTAYAVFKALREGRLKMDDELSVSPYARSMEGSRMFLEVGSRAKVSDLLRGIIIQSGNDACVTLAEGLSSNDRAFGEELTQLATAIGATKTNFVNSTGLPDERHVTTARDLATISLCMIKEFPDYYPLFSEREFTYNNIKQGNRNPLLYKNIGADGIKTGSTEIAGFGLVGSVVQNGRRLLLVINGLKSMQERATESEKIISWGFREFENYTLFPAQKIVGTAHVLGGVEETVEVVPHHDVILTLARDQRNKVTSVVIHTPTLAAPLSTNQVVAKLVIKIPEKGERTFDLYPAKNIERAGMFTRFGRWIKRLIWGAPSSASKKESTSGT